VVAAETLDLPGKEPDCLVEFASFEEEPAVYKIGLLE